MFNHSYRMHLFRRNILLRVLFLRLSPFFLGELFRTWRDKTVWDKVSRSLNAFIISYMKRAPAEINIRSSMSNVLTLILTLFPMTYRTTEYNLMQRKWILLLWDSKSKHWCTHKVFMLVICHITHLRIMIKEL